MLLVNVDYTIALRGLSLNDDKLTQGFYARQMILCYHEFFEDYQKLFGKGLREILGGLPKADQYMQRLSEMGKELRAFRDQHAKRFRDIRNAVAAHRDHDGEKQLQMMDQELQKLTSDLEIWFNKLWNFACQLVTDYRELMQQVQTGIAYFMSLMSSPKD